MYLMTNDTSGGCIDWVVDKLFHPKDCGLEMEDCYKLVDDMLDHTEPGANHLFFSTWFSGERQPICDDYVRAGFWNMNLDHGRGHMVRAVYEGIAYEIRWALEKFEETHGLRYEKLRVSGGGAKSDRLMQIVADITGITVDVIEDAAFAVAKGTAFLGFIAAGILTYEDVRSLVHVKKSFAPRAEYKELYDNGSYFYQKYYETTKDFFRELNTKSNR
jgi:xylulokinase